MRTRGAVEDLVVVDLDDPDEVSSRGPVAQRHHFEDRYAELPFGLGTVPRRLDHTPWYARPGGVAFIVVAMLGLFVLGSAGSGPAADDHSSPALPSPPTLRDRTHTTLVLLHIGQPTALDVDRRSLRPVRDPLDGPEPQPQVLATEGTSSTSGPSVSAFVSGRWRPIATNALLLGTGARTVVWRPMQCREECPVWATDVRSRRTHLLVRFHPRLAEISNLSFAPGDRAVALFDPGGHPAWRIVDLRHGITHDVDVTTWSERLTTWSRDGHWFFLSNGAELLAVGPDGTARRVDVTLPPFEQLSTG